MTIRHLYASFKQQHWVLRWYAYLALPGAIWLSYAKDFRFWLGWW